MADHVSGSASYTCDLEAIRAVGGMGSAVFVIARTEVAANLLEAASVLGWRFTCLVLDERADSHAHRPHQRVVVTSSQAVPDVLADRFHAGVPLHYLDASQLASTVVEEILKSDASPWIIHCAPGVVLSVPYTHVTTTNEGQWFIHQDHAHLAPGIVRALGDPGSPAESLPGSWRARGHRKAQHLRARLREYAPRPLRTALIRRSHLRHVQANQFHLTDPAYLGKPIHDECTWITPDGMPPIPEAGLELGTMQPHHVSSVRAWLAAGPYDSDEFLNRRMDNHDDELGRTIAALRLRLRMREGGVESPANGTKVLFDARSLQTATYGARGIGRFALAALQAVREAVEDAHLDLLVDRSLEVLPEDLVGSCTQVVRVINDEVANYSVLVQPSPMTARADPIVPLLLSNAHKIAIVFDFIPAHYPSIYLRHPAARAEYAAALDALRCYDEYVCISWTTQRELCEWRASEEHEARMFSTSVAWPVGVEPEEATHRMSAAGPIVVMTGDEPRKNTYGALAAIGAATAGHDENRDIRVLGMAGHDVRIHHWAIAAALRPGETETVPRISDTQMHELLTQASLVVVASFDEGLSLPVIEAVSAGVPIVASDIPAHRELVGEGSFLVPAGDISAMAKAITIHRGRQRTREVQASRLRAHQHTSLEAHLKRTVGEHRIKRGVTHGRHPESTSIIPSGKLSVGVATPWYPQPTGVADFSVATIRELAQLADVTVYTTSGAVVEDSIPHKHIDTLFAQPHSHDAVISVIGNSHFHIPFVELLGHVDCIAIAHDTRMIEYYMAMRAKGGAEQVMLRGQQQRRISPGLDEQIEDMRLLQNAGLWEISHQAQELILHSPSAAPRIAYETGIEPRVLPFANQRVPDTPVVTSDMRRRAREILGLDDSLVHIGSFGYVDIRTKLTDVVVEAAAWLTQWGYPVALHVVGAATAEQARALGRRARSAGIHQFAITGFQGEESFRNYLLAVDVGVQLRVSPLLGVSGPLSDLAAFGTPSVASQGLAVDVGTPGYITRLPDEVSSLIVAEAIEKQIVQPMHEPEREYLRLQYLAEKTPARYAQQLYAIVEEVVR